MTVSKPNTIFLCHIMNLLPPPSEISAEDISHVRKLLKKRFKKVDGYIEIAIGEAVSKILTGGLHTSRKPIARLYAIAKNKILNEVKRSKKFKGIEGDLNADIPPELVVKGPEEFVLSDLTEQELELLLSVKQRRVVTLRMEGYSFEEIADKEGVSIDAVKDRFKSIRKKMKKYL